ncbi:MAG: hypothetical protein HKM96_05805 [Boseongicola sp.]|nr:hypothetical protein [Boseongicola sp.]
MAFYRLVHAIACLGWLGAVVPLAFAPGLLRHFEMESWRDHLPTSVVVGGMLILAFWMLVRRILRGPLRGRWTLWASVAGLAFTMMGGMIAYRAPEDWIIWAGPLTMGLAFFVLATEPFVRGHQ